MKRTLIVLALSMLLSATPGCSDSTGPCVENSSTVRLQVGPLTPGDPIGDLRAQGYECACINRGTFICFEFECTICED